MPKANHGGATAAGLTGIVEHGAPLADGRRLSELDPEKNLDGTLIEGEHPDHAAGERRDLTGLVVSEPVPQDEDLRTEEQTRTQPVDAPFEKAEEKGEPWDGNSSQTSPAKTPATRKPNGARGQ